MVTASAYFNNPGIAVPVLQMLAGTFHGFSTGHIKNPHDWAPQLEFLIWLILQKLCIFSKLLSDANGADLGSTLWRISGSQ
jgi:hypothetical protein